VGVHGRNDHEYHGQDYDLVREAKIESVKMMSFNPVHVFHQLRDVTPDLDLVVRLYDGRMGAGGNHPTPAQFADTFIPIMRDFQPYATKFEVHNEPNHLHGIEGWGQEDHYAHDFNAWFLQVYDRLKQACPWASLGFPGLAIPHRDLEWIEICRPSVEKADWLGVHCYWQNPTSTEGNHLDDFWGLRFKSYHEKFPDKLIEITEFGNSNCQGGLPVVWDRIAKEHVDFYQEVFKYAYIRSASAFIMSAPQREWDGFCWRREDGAFRPMVQMVGNMERPPLFDAEEPGPPPIPIPPTPECTTAHLRFEHGDMLRFCRILGDLIFVIYDFYHWQVFHNDWDGVEAKNPIAPIPEGFAAPQRGFRDVWVREELWGTSSDQEYPPLCLGWALKSVANPSGEEIPFDGHCIEKDDKWIVTDSDGRELWLDKYTHCWAWVR